MNLTGTIYIICASVLWGVAHSVLASHSVKDVLRRAVGPRAFDKLYRFSYNFFALASFFPIAAMLYTFPDRPLYTIPSPWIYATVVLQGLAAILLMAAVVQTGPLEFMGLEQLFEIGETKPPVLMTDGWYAIIRHPLYSGLLVFGWLIPEMTVNRLALLIVLSLYIFIGAWFEERKLLKDFDPAYAEYKARVPMFVPKIGKSPNHKITQ
jgi:protein-S-isoprenylcysteine O-methyltransferase Ste14